jgi:phosphoribosylaminoimidazole-succinocarboxamide synthase
MNKGREIARGKTKVLYEAVDRPDLCVISSQDAITAGDGLRRNVIEGKGRIAAKTTARVFRLLNLCGLPTHYVSGGEDDDDNEMLVRRARMIPLEVVVRGVAAGSYVKRNPGLARASLLVPRVIEFFLKDDANHDPLIEPNAIVAGGYATPAELGAMSELARMTFEILAHAWRRFDTLLVDMKIEFGRIASGEGAGSLVIADVIDNDSWRIWPQGREELMLDKQTYRNLAEVTEADLAKLRADYERVAEMTGTFPTARAGMIAVVTDGPEHAARGAEVARAVGVFGLPIVRHIVSAQRTPAYALQLVSGLEARFPRLVFVAVGPQAGGLAGILEYASPAPVIRVDDETDLDLVALQCAKALGLDDTIAFGRVLMRQAQARSSVLQADGALNTPAPSGGAFA